MDLSIGSAASASHLPPLSLTPVCNAGCGAPTPTLLASARTARAPSGFERSPSEVALSVFRLSPPPLIFTDSIIVPMRSVTPSVPVTIDRLILEEERVVALADCITELFFSIVAPSDPFLGGTIKFSLTVDKTSEVAKTRIACTREAVEALISRERSHFSINLSLTKDEAVCVFPVHDMLKGLVDDIKRRLEGLALVSPDQIAEIMRELTILTEAPLTIDNSHLIIQFIIDSLHSITAGREKDTDNELFTRLEALQTEYERYFDMISTVKDILGLTGNAPVVEGIIDTTELILTPIIPYEKICFINPENTRVIHGSNTYDLKTKVNPHMRSSPKDPEAFRVLLEHMAFAHILTEAMLVEMEAMGSLAPTVTGIDDTGKEIVIFHKNLPKATIRFKFEGTAPRVSFVRGDIYTPKTSGFNQQKDYYYSPAESAFTEIQEHIRRDLGFMRLWQAAQKMNGNVDASLTIEFPTKKTDCVEKG